MSERVDESLRLMYEPPMPACKKDKSQPLAARDPGLHHYSRRATLQIHSSVTGSSVHLKIWTARWLEATIQIPCTRLTKPSRLCGSPSALDRCIFAMVGGWISARGTIAYGLCEHVCTAPSDTRSVCLWQRWRKITAIHALAALSCLSHSVLRGAILRHMPSLGPI